MSWTDFSELAETTIVPLLTGGVLTLVLTRQFERATQKRELFAKAYQTVLSWQEMLYRVRRRAMGNEAERQLIEYFHNLQEQLNYFQGILSSESKSLGKSYEKFVNTVKRENVILIQQAWESNIRKPNDGTPKKEVHPNINSKAEQFLKDVRQWLAWWQIPKFAVWWRNR